MRNNLLKNILQAFQQKYHFTIGVRPSSPVLEFSLGLILQYAQQLAHAPLAERQPFYLCVPQKEHFTVHFSCTLLLNYFFEDYVSLKPMQVSGGDKVEIFGAIAKYTGVTTELGKKRIRLLFSDGVTCNAPDSYRLHMVKVEDKRMLNTVDYFKKQRRTYLKNNDLNSLFGLGYNEAVNPNAFSSKLYLVTGRGYAASTREKLKNENCINQSRDKVFRVGTNLIVTPSLEEIAPIFNTTTGEDNSYFITSLTEDLTQLLEVYDGDKHLVDVIDRLSIHLKKQDFSENFRQLFERLVDSVDDPYRTRLLNLAGNMPVTIGVLPDSLKMVVLDNIDLAATYTNTINGLVVQGIPVIILCDRAELASRKDNIVDGPMNSYRFYWSRERIRSLIEAEKVEYCDGQFWQRCLHYVNQGITIRSFSDSVGDRLFNTFESNPAFALLDGFENLKKTYHQYLRPALYLLKNTPGRHPEIIQSLKEQVNGFSEAFRLVESQLPVNLATSLAHGLTEIISYTTNPKSIPDGLPVFIQQIEFPDGIRQQTAHLTYKALRLTDLKQSKTDALIFTGFPYREWNGKYLFDAVFHTLIRSVIILTWPTEAQRTINYLTKRIHAASFADNLPHWISNRITNWQLPYQQGRPDESDLILHEGELAISAASVSKPLHAEVAFEEVQRYISNFRFAGLSIRTDDAGDYMVLVDVLYFHDGSYMLLPHGRGGQVNVVSTHYKVTGDIDQASFQELSVGDIVVCFNMNREIIRHLAREHLFSAYEHLDLWRNSLQSLLNAKSGQFSKLEALLMQQKELLGLSTSSPTRKNIMRWLYETDMLAPHIANLWLILRASGLSERDAESALGKIEKAKRLIIRNSSQVSGRIRSKIMTFLRDSQLPEADILLDVDGITVAVQCGRITDKEKRTDMEVPYASTKRFIKD